MKEYAKVSLCLWPFGSFSVSREGKGIRPGEVWSKHFVHMDEILKGQQEEG